MFAVEKQTENSLARVGVLEINGRRVETPAYVIVATDAKVRCLEPEDLLRAGVDMVIANTYHLWLGTAGLNAAEIARRGGLGKVMGFDGVTMTDSGGFQVFSYGASREHGVGKLAPIFPFDGTQGGPGEHRNVGEDTESKERNLVRITDDGVFFRVDGEEKFLGPEKSIAIQAQIGADIILAFDECTSPLHDYEYTKRAMERTHRWAKICLETKKREDQLLYGIVQGGAYEDLRKESAKIIGEMPFGGFAIGGSLGKSRKEMFDVIRWTVPFLPNDRPRHLLGIGRTEDIFDAVELGIDTFDCVIPTREARHGSAWTRRGRIDLGKGFYKNDLIPIEKDCGCPVCASGKTRAEIHEMLKFKDAQALCLLTLHNVYFFNNLMRKIREAIRTGKLKELRKEYLGSL